MTAPNPANLAPAGPTRQQRGIQLPQLLLSLLVVAVFALLAVWWQASTTSRTPVLAIATDVEQGSPLQASDLTEIYISSDVPANVQPAANAGAFVDARPITDLPAGTLVTPQLFVKGAELLPGQAFVGLIVDESRAPGNIVRGDRVQVIAPGGEGGYTVLTPNALVEAASGSRGEVVLRLRMGIDEAQAVQISSNQVVVIEVGDFGLAAWEEGGVVEDGNEGDGS